MTLENTPFVWGAAFLLDVITGFMMFSVMVRKNAPAYTLGAAWWIGWWSWASAFTLIINMVVGTDNPFSYHQIGVFTESMTNIGVLWWIVVLQSKNWYVYPKDWLKIEMLRARLGYSNMIKAIKQRHTNDSK